MNDDGDNRRALPQPPPACRSKRRVAAKRRRSGEGRVGTPLNQALLPFPCPFHSLFPNHRLFHHHEKDACDSSTALFHAFKHSKDCNPPPRTKQGEAKKEKIGGAAWSLPIVVRTPRTRRPPSPWRRLPVQLDAQGPHGAAPNLGVKRGARAAPPIAKERWFGGGREGGELFPSLSLSSRIARPRVLVGRRTRLVSTRASTGAPVGSRDLGSCPRKGGAHAGSPCFIFLNLWEPLPASTSHTTQSPAPSFNTHNPVITSILNQKKRWPSTPRSPT
jgi:hypothetical protein